MAKYKDVVVELKNRMYERDLLPGNKLPTEDQMAEEFGCARGTIKQAIKVLIDDGYVKQVKKGGIYVLNSHKLLYPGEVAQQKRGLTAAKFGRDIKTEVHHLDILQVDDFLAQKLNVAEGTYVYEIKRLRFVDQIAHSYEHLFIRTDVVPQLKRKYIEKSIFHYLNKVLKLDLGDSHRQITCHISDDQHKGLFDIEEDFPVLKEELVNYLEDDTPYLYGNILYNGLEKEVNLII